MATILLLFLLIIFLSRSEFSEKDILIFIIVALILARGGFMLHGGQWTNF